MRLLLLILIATFGYNQTSEAFTGVASWAHSVSKQTTAQMLTSLGLTSGLLVNLDAGDSASYNGSSQTWTDRSGLGNHFYLGSGSGADGSDPTFTGTSGGLSASDYFTVNTGDYFTESLAGWGDDNFHKNGATFTIALVVYEVGYISGYPAYYGNGTDTTTGSYLGLNRPGPDLFYASWNFGMSQGTPGVTSVLTSGSWHFIAVSINENGGAGASLAMVDSTTTTFDANYPSPSSGNATYSAKIMADGSGGSYHSNGARIMSFMVWNRALTATELSNLRSRFKQSRLPALP